MNKKVCDTFKRSGLADVIGDDQFYLNGNRAVDSLEDEQEKASHLA